MALAQICVVDTEVVQLGTVYVIASVATMDLIAPNALVTVVPHG